MCDLPVLWRRRRSYSFLQRWRRHSSMQRRRIRSTLFLVHVSFHDDLTLSRVENIWSQSRHFVECMFSLWLLCYKWYPLTFISVFIIFILFINSQPNIFLKLKCLSRLFLLYARFEKKKKQTNRTLRGFCKKFCHWVRITSVLRFIKHISITNLQSIPPLLKHLSVTFLPSRVDK